MKSKEEHLLLLLLLLLAVFVLQARCQHEPRVSMSPSFSPIFSGDSITLICDSRPDSLVSWYFNNDVVPMQMYETWTIAVVAPQHSGSYQCESYGKRSDAVSIDVLDYLPPAVLSIKTGQPVMRRKDGFSLELQSEDGVQGWQCRVNKNGQVKTITFKSVKGLDSVTFQPYSLTGPEAVYWCHDNTTQRRSGQVTIRTSGKAVSMEMLPRPAVVGEDLTLRCLAWGTDQISRTVFYKDEKVIQDGHSSTYQIHNVTELSQGQYKCDATFTFRGSTGGPPHNEVSDVQELFVQASPLRAVLSADRRLSCSCPNCHGGASYRWYHKEPGQPFALLSSRQSHLKPTVAGVYACRAVWVDRRTSLSHIFMYAQPASGLLPIVIAIVIVLVAILLLVGMFLVIYRWWKKRDVTDPVYEDVALRQVSPGENEYEQLRKKHSAQEEYETLPSAAMGTEKKEGEYQALQKEEGEGGVYNTLGMGEAAGGVGGYQALETRDKDKEYETLEG